MSVQLFDNDLLPERTEVDLKEKISALLSSSQGMTIRSEQDFNRITFLYSEARKWEDRIEVARKQSNQNDQDRIKIRNDRAKELLVPLKKLQAITKEKAAQYQLFLENLKEEEVARMESTIDLLGLTEMPYIPPAELKHRSSGASMNTKIVKRFKVVDFDNVPNEFKIIDEKKIEDFIKVGGIEISGIQIYEERITQLKRN